MVAKNAESCPEVLEENARRCLGDDGKVLVGNAQRFPKVFLREPGGMHSFININQDLY